MSARTLGLILWVGGTAYLDHGRRERAEELWHQLEELGERTRDGMVLLQSIVTEAALATVDGRLEESLAIGERLLTKAEELGTPVFGRQFATLVTGRPLLHLGGGRGGPGGLAPGHPNGRGRGGINGDLAKSPLSSPPGSPW